MDSNSSPAHSDLKILSKHDSESTLFPIDALPVLLKRQCSLLQEAAGFQPELTAMMSIAYVQGIASDSAFLSQAVLAILERDFGRQHVVCGMNPGRKFPEWHVTVPHSQDSAALFDSVIYPWQSQAEKLAVAKYAPSEKCEELADLQYVRERAILPKETFPGRRYLAHPRVKLHHLEQSFNQEAGDGDTWHLLNFLPSSFGSYLVGRYTGVPEEVSDKQLENHHQMSGFLYEDCGVDSRWEKGIREIDAFPLELYLPLSSTPGKSVSENRRTETIRTGWDELLIPILAPALSYTRESFRILPELNEHLCSDLLELEAVLKERGSTVPAFQLGRMMLTTALPLHLMDHNLSPNLAHDTLDVALGITRWFVEHANCPYAPGSSNCPEADPSSATFKHQ